MAKQLSPQEKDIWQVVQAVRQLVEGRNNASGQVTLTANAASTVVSHPNCSVGSSPTLTPATAHAAAEMGNGTIYVSAISNGSFTLTHANNAQVDRTFYYSVGGG